MAERIAVYAGSFDPITNGHLDIIHRAASLFDRLVIVVATNSAKKPLFTWEERFEFISQSLNGVDNRLRLAILPDKKLLADFAAEIGACAMIRGLRPVQDFPGEFSLASINRRIHPEIETIMLVTDPSVSEVSSSMVKELAALNGPYEQFVSGIVAEALKKKFG